MDKKQSKAPLLEALNEYDMDKKQGKAPVHEALNEYDMDKKQSKAPLLEALKEYSNRRPAYFCVPGHRYENGIDPEFLEAAGAGVFRMDITETPLTDDLHAPEGCIREAQELAAELFGAGRTWFLVNGSSCSIEAMLLAAAGEGQTVCLARNAHRSAVSGLVLSGSRPVYINPEYLENTGIQGGISPEAAERMFSEHQDCRALLVVSPTYYGSYSDIEKLAEVCHGHGALLLVDEAHGAFGSVSEGFPKGALECGADMCVQSMHKTAGSLTQSSMLHASKALCSQHPELIARLEAALRMVQSTSPSYLLMASLDAARRDLAENSATYAKRLLWLAEHARSGINAIPGMSCKGPELKGQAFVFDQDPSRLIISAKGLEISGFALKEMLFEEHGVDVEMADENNVLALVSYANTEDDTDRLIEALRSISEKAGAERCAAAEKQACGTSGQEDAQSQCDQFSEDGLPAQTHKIESKNSLMTSASRCGKPVQTCKTESSEALMHGLPEQVLTPRQAFFADKKRVPWKGCAGKVSAEMIAPYPPGIAVICPGERISAEAWELIESVRLRGGHMQGPSDPELSTILTIE